MAQGGLGNGKTKGKSRSLDLEDIEQMMRDLLFSTDPRAKKSFELPAMDKPTRVKVHAMAQALHLKSTSNGGKNSEHKTMVISRTKNSGMRTVNEGKIDSLMKRKRGTGKYGAEGHIREGDVIGHKAAKIDEGNIGYRLLAQMGCVSVDFYCFSEYSLCLERPDGQRETGLVGKEVWRHQSSRYVHSYWTWINCQLPTCFPLDHEEV
jgi:hypothetical protein